MKNLIRCTGLAVGLLVLSACQSSSYLYVQETVAGVDVGVGTSGNNRLSIGYTTDTFAIIPQKGTGSDAASSIAIIDGAIKGIKCFNYEQFNATGKAAENLAKEAQVITKVREKIYGSPQDNKKKCKGE
jgi:hypothetical protein